MVGEAEIQREGSSSVGGREAAVSDKGGGERWHVPASHRPSPQIARTRAKRGVEKPAEREAAG